LLVLTVVGGVVRWRAAPRAVRILDRLTVPFLRGILGGVAALGVMAAPPAPPIAPATTTPVDSQATLHLEPAESETAPAPSAVAPDDNTWTVQSGESFWS